MADSQGSSPLHDDDGDPNTTDIQLISLTSRFKALSRLATLSIDNVQTGTAIASPTHQSSRTKDAEVDLDQGRFGSCLDNASPDEDIDVARKRQKGVQDPPGLSSRNEFVPGQDKKSSASHNLILPTSTLDTPPIRASTDLVRAVPDIGPSFLAPMSTSRRRGGTRRNHTAASAFLGYFNTGVTEQCEEDDKGGVKSLDAKELVEEDLTIKAEVNEKIRVMKVEDVDEGLSFHFEPEGETSGELRSEAGPIKLEFPNGELDTQALAKDVLQEPPPVIAKEIIPTAKIANSIPKLENPGLKRLPDAVLSRYPRMGKYINTLAAQENSTGRVVSAPLVVSNETTIMSNIVAQKPVKAGEATTIREENRCIVVPGKVSHGDENSGLLGTKALIEATFEPRVAERLENSPQEDTVQSRPILANLNKPVENTLSGKELEETTSSLVEETKLLQSASTRPRLPERYAIPVMAQGNEVAAQKTTVKVSSDRVAAEKGQQLEKDPLMEQLAMIDERFSRDPEGTLIRSNRPAREQHDFSFFQPSTRRSSMSSEASITFSIAPGVPNHPDMGTAFTREISQNAGTPAQASRSTDATNIEDYDRFRRSMTPSPSPYLGRTVVFPTTNSGRMLTGDNSISITSIEGSGQQTADGVDMAGRWLEQFTSSAKTSNTPRAQPSILARMHKVSAPIEDTSNERFPGVDDGVAPGEWVQPSGLSRKMLGKPKIGMTAEPPPPLFQVTQAPLLGSVRGSAAGSVAGSAHRGQRFYTPAAEDGSSVARGAPDIVQPRPRIDKANTARELEQARQREKTIIEWRERGFAEVGRLDENTQVDLNKRLLEEQRQIYGGNLLGESLKGGSENSRGRWKAPREGGLFASPPSSTRAASPSSLTIQARVVTARGSVPALLPPVRQQTVDPNVQDIVAILRDIQTTQKAKPRAGGSVSPAPNTNDTISRTWKSFSSSAPPGPQAPMAPLAPKVIPKKTEVKQPVVAAVVRKLCPIFLIGPCRHGQSCLDLHPTYDEQSGTYLDKRFGTKEVFSEEILKKAEKEKERQKALEELIKQSRDAADKKCYEKLAGKGHDPKARRKPRALQVAAGVIVQKNAKGEKDWIIYPPKPPPPPPPPPPPVKKMSDSDSDDFRPVPTKVKAKHR